MRTLDLGRTFDLVLIHDAIMYATEPEHVLAAPVRRPMRARRARSASFSGRGFPYFV